MSLPHPLQCSSLPLQTPNSKTPKPQPTTTFQWNSLLRSHLSLSNPTLALLSYRSMLLSGALPDSHSLPLALQASLLSDLPSLSKQLHCQSLKLNLLSNPFVLSSLIQNYSHFEGTHLASLVFNHAHVKKVQSWTLLAALYLKDSKPTNALQLFDQMLQSNLNIDSVALITFAKAASQTKSILDAKKVCEIAEKKGFLEGNVLVGNAVVKMYVECGRIGDARLVFDSIPDKDVVSWTTMINGYIRIGGFNEGLKLFRAMCSEREKPDSFAVSAVLPACARMAAWKNGKEIHAYVIRHRMGRNGMNATLENALMDMYVKSGSIEAASKVFERMVWKDTISWTVMILGYSLHGEGKVGIELFREMKEKGGVLPDQTTFVAALHACNTACLVEKGRSLFDRIVKPQPEHCALMAGLLSRAGLFIEARAFIKEHRMDKYAVVHRAVLDGCRIHRNVKLGKRIAEQLTELEPLNAENYVLLSNAYAAIGKWELVKEFRDTIRDMGLKPRRAYSWIEVRSKVHVFETGDVSHPRSKGIYWELERLMKEKRQIEEDGHMVREDFSLHNVHEERECIPCGHSEMLAIGFGLISGGGQGAGVVRVTKNLRVCRNCHESVKAISEIVGQEIVLKDPHRFHHFKDGACSCREMW